jgi:hypothetical protein
MLWCKVVAAVRLPLLVLCAVRTSVKKKKRLWVLFCTKKSFWSWDFRKQRRFNNPCFVFDGIITHRQVTTPIQWTTKWAKKGYQEGKNSKLKRALPERKEKGLKQYSMCGEARESLLTKHLTYIFIWGNSFCATEKIIFFLC